MFKWKTSQITTIFISKYRQFQISGGESPHIAFESLELRIEALRDDEQWHETGHRSEMVEKSIKIMPFAAKMGMEHQNDDELTFKRASLFAMINNNNGIRIQNLRIE